MTCVTTDVFLSKAKLPRFLIKKQARKRGEGNLAPRILNFQMQMVSFKIQHCNPRKTARWEAVELKKLLPVYRPNTYKRLYSSYLRRPHVQSETCSQSQQKEYKVEFWLMNFPFLVLQKFSFCQKIQVFLNVRLRCWAKSSRCSERLQSSPSGSNNFRP